MTMGLVGTPSQTPSHRSGYQAHETDQFATRKNLHCHSPEGERHTTVHCLWQTGTVMAETNPSKILSIQIEILGHSLRRVKGKCEYDRGINSMALSQS